jgi:hypothetical protein
VPTDVADIRLFTSVRFRVTVEVLTNRESPTAHQAQVRSVAGVRHLVLVEVLFPREALAALVTLVSLFAKVHDHVLAQT